MRTILPNQSIFLHIPKCAGMSIELFCIENGIKIAPLNRTQEWCDNVNGSTHPNIGWSIPENIYGVWDQEINSPDYFTFAFVRNPWDRMVSAWKSTNVSRKYADKEFKSFLEFIFTDKPNMLRASHILSYFDPSYKLFDRDDRQVVDFIGRFEILQEGFDEVCRLIGATPRKLQHLNKSEHQAYSQYYDLESKEFVESRFSKDIEYFNYSF